MVPKECGVFLDNEPGKYQLEYYDVAKSLAYAATKIM